MEKNRIQKLEQILKDYFAAYGCLTNSPDETVQSVFGKIGMQKKVSKSA